MTQDSVRIVSIPIAPAIISVVILQVPLNVMLVTTIICRNLTELNPNKAGIRLTDFVRQEYGIIECREALRLLHCGNVV